MAINSINVSDLGEYSPRLATAIAHYSSLTSQPTMFRAISGR